MAKGHSKAFWGFATLMLRRRWCALWAVVFAFVSAASLGAALVVLQVVLEGVLSDEPRGLRAWSGEIDGWLATNLGVTLPPSVLNALPAEPYPSVVWTMVALGVLTVFGGVANFLHAYLSMTVSVDAVGDVRRRAFHRLLHVPLATVIHDRSSDLVSRVVQDTNVLTQAFTALTSKAMANVTKGGAALAAAFVISWRLSLVTLVAAPVLAVVIRKLGKRIRRAARGAMHGQAQMLGLAGEVMQGFRVVKVYGGERREIGRFSKVNHEVMRQQKRARTARALASPVTEVIAFVAMGALALMGVKAIFDGVLTRTEFFAALGALGFAASSLKPLNGIVQTIQTGYAAAERLKKVIEMPMEDEVHERRKPAVGRLRDRIGFEGVRFAYTGGDEALRGINLEVERGTTVAFVGPNGSGKTTLLSLVPRLFEPTEGRVTLDGVDVRDVSLRSLRSQIGVVTQEVVLFYGTIADNIAYARPDATRDEIEEAGRRAGADGFIQKMPGGYDAMVGDQGLTLSGGQRQRISIARAILRDPAILIMDEATSMIDAESEARITEAITSFARAGEGRTCLIVAHRLSTVVNADRIVVLDAGRIIDDGTHAELAERCAVYQQLVKHQLAPAVA